MIQYYKKLWLRWRNSIASFDKGEAEPCPHWELFRTYQTTLHCFRFLKSFSDVKNYCQLFGTPVSYLPRSASWTKEWGGDLPLTYRSKYWLRYGYLGTLNACNQWLIDLTLQHRFYFVFIAEFVERLPTIFLVNIWGTCLFEIEHRWAKWLISDPSPKGTRCINGPMNKRFNLGIFFRCMSVILQGKTMEASVL